MRLGTCFAAGLAALASACTSQSDYIAPSYVSPSTFEHLTCRQIGEEQKRITRAEATGGRLDGKPGDPDDIALLKARWKRSRRCRLKRTAISNFNTDDGAARASQILLDTRCTNLRQKRMRQNCGIAPTRVCNCEVQRGSARRWRPPCGET